MKKIYTLQKLKKDAAAGVIKAVDWGENLDGSRYAIATRYPERIAGISIPRDALLVTTAKGAMRAFAKPQAIDIKPQVVGAVSEEETPQAEGINKLKNLLTQG